MKGDKLFPDNEKLLCVDGLRPEIQGLRAIAIVAVLLFHMWSNYFPVGYLGVDCFFVISGYLMIMLMSRKKELTLNDSILFYYRRVKRIVPTYIFVIVLTLIACYMLISEFEFDQIVSEATSPLFFYSNFPFVHKFNYFDNKSKYRFFLHTWSLSCELQFYLFVPLLMLIISLLTNIHFFITLLFIFTISTTSFYRQVTSTSNAKHMTLDGRVWQFMFGFFAHFVYTSKLITFTVIDLIDYQVQRFFVVFLTALIISIRQDDSILSNKLLVKLGDISYSVYLIHWPIFTMHRYLDSNLYESENEAGFIGFVLIAVSILSGYVIEEKSKQILASVKNWWHLIRLLFVLYLFSGICLMFLHKDAMKLVEEKPLSRANERKILKDTLMLWESRNNEKSSFPNSKLMTLNSEISYGMPICHNHTKKLPSSFKNLSAFSMICNDQGNGDKNIVVFGNSHAFRAFVGIAQIFKPIAKTITLVSTSGCVPGSYEHQSNAEENVLNLLKMGIFAWVKFQTFTDSQLIEVQNEVNDFYAKINDVVREAVFVPGFNVLFTRDPLRQILYKLKANQTVGQIGNTRTTFTSRLPQIQQLYENVNCSKCIKTNWFNLWCKDDFCSAVDKRNILYFGDDHHVTSYGAMFVGEYLLNTYKNYMNKKH
ncbi:O-acetyltransferase OatA [Aphelenchoides bicaudatus]|nr:O-acetyltransferase OatA [Aphelenchoides bicaudatus]